MTPGILVIEGADASGKTTLARYLRAHHGARYLHLGPSTDVWRLHVAAYHRAATLAARGHLVVVDRHWPSEVVYGAAYRGGSAYPIAARCFDRLWLRSAALYVIAAPVDIRRHVTEFRAGARRRAEYAPDVERVASVYHHLAYGDAFPFAIPGNDYLARQARHLRWADWPNVEVYDRFEEGKDLAAVTDRLLSRLTGWRASQHPLGLDPATPAYAGHWAAARWLLVGEGPNPRRPAPRPELSVPFVDRCSSVSSSTWLNQALHELEIPETVLAWSNARDASGSESREVRALAADARFRSLPAIALGRVAERTLRALGFTDVRPVPHPQWARRFKHALFDRYVERLGEALQ